MASKWKNHARCICGCGRKNGVQFHHAIYRQELRRNLPRTSDGLPDVVREMEWLTDRRNLVPVGPKCHANHHHRYKPFLLSMLPDSVFEFASEVMGAGPAYEYLRRRYDGDDPRLEAFLQDYERQAVA